MCRSCIFFFFSSRRRHTRCSRDWSSDVCSSDLCEARAATWRLRPSQSRAAQLCASSPTCLPLVRWGWAASPRPRRSEEHTSELQSRLHLVCRLLLEKKKTKKDMTTPYRCKLDVT